MRKLRPHELNRPDALPHTPLVVVLDDVRSAHNVGAVLRTADAVRARCIISCGYTPGPGHPAVAKTALGAENVVPWESAADAVEVIQRLRAKGYTAAALELTDVSIPLDDYPPSRSPVALVLGNEVSGISQRVLDVCDLAVSIPQWGAKHSLNVSVAFGVAAYGLIRQISRLQHPHERSG